jgi:lysophospholipase L1-like esterase
MKKYLFLFAACFVLLGTMAQQPAWDSTFRPNNYALKTEEFRSFPNAGSDIIFLGNSITAGIEWSELLGFANVRNRGISGDITFGVLERLDEVTEGKPAKVFILIGINDISRNVPDDVILNNYKRIIAYIKQQSPSTKIHFYTLMPVNNEFTQFKNHYNKDEHILAVNAGLKQIASASGVVVIDLYPHFQDGAGKLDKRYTIDGLHINAAGYKVWADLLKKGGYLK